MQTGSRERFKTIELSEHDLGLLLVACEEMLTQTTGYVKDDYQAIHGKLEGLTLK